MGAANALSSSTNFNSSIFEEMLTTSKVEGRTVAIVLDTFEKRTVRGVVDSFSLSDGLIKLKDAGCSILVVARFISCMWLY